MAWVSPWTPSHSNETPTWPFWWLHFLFAILSWNLHFRHVVAPFSAIWTHSWFLVIILDPVVSSPGSGLIHPGPNSLPTLRSTLLLRSKYYPRVFLLQIPEFALTAYICMWFLGEIMRLSSFVIFLVCFVVCSCLDEHQALISHNLLQTWTASSQAPPAPS